MERHAVILGLSRQAKLLGLPMPYMMAVGALTMLPFTLSGSVTVLASLDFLGFGRVVSLSIVIAVIDVVLLTALATLGAFLYNIVASLVGGLHLTLTDD